MKRGVYVHVPFCERRCGYCHFLTFARRGLDIEGYFENVWREIALYTNRTVEIDTIYFGGGTPSFVDERLIAKTIQVIKASFSVVGEDEITLEANPESVSKEKVHAWIKAGVNRISLGFQAAQQKHLNLMGRQATFEKVVSAVNLIRESGINNINLDLIFGLPEQTLDEWSESLEKAISLSPTHLSIYSLEFHQGTAFEGLRRKGSLIQLGEELDRQMRDLAIERLTSAGLMQYEISNFAKSGFESRHNLNFWLNHEYYGFGLGADGFVADAVYHNVEMFEEYGKKIIVGEKPIVASAKLDEKDLRRDKLILGLRLNRGVDLDLFGEFETQLEELKGQVLLVVDEGKVKLTRKGQDLENLVMEKFV